MSKKVILWDWDNTLVDTFGAIWAAQNDMRVHFGLPRWSKEEAKAAMNKSGRNLIKDLVGEEKQQEARSFYLSQYALYARQLQLKPHAKEILTWAHQNDFYNILASNKTGDILRNEVAAVGLTDYFDKMIGAQDNHEDKPSKSFTDAALRGVEWNLLISIGDGQADIQMARNYPTAKGILIKDSSVQEDFKIQPDFVCKNLNIEEILEKLGSSLRPVLQKEQNTY